MKVLFDARWILVENRFDGVSRYSHELAHAMAARKDLDITWLIHDKRQLEKLPKGNYLLANNPNNIVAEALTLARRITAAGHTVVYSPFFMMGTLGKRYKLVLTIHDMIYFTHRTPPQWLPWYIRFGWWLFHTSYWPMRWQLNRADHIATVSSTARQELLDAHATKRPITTVSNAVNESFADPTKRQHYSKNNVVYMGAFTPYKNVECLIDALPLVPEVTLHLCGKMPLVRRTQLVERMRQLGVTKRVIIYDGATDEQYKKALSEARCSMSASRLEGFGLPVLEAQQHGVPFGCADTPIFHEIGKDSVLYFDPNSPDEAAEVMRRFADKTTSERYIAAGHQNVRRYSWANSASVASRICRELIGS